MLRFLRILHESNAVLSITGWAHLLLLITLIAIAPFDSRTILGINPWIKPMKFSVSIAIYVWTLAWYLRYLGSNPRKIRVVSWGVAISMFAEIFLIVLQSARGVTSHFNNDTPLDAAIFGVMGLMILLNSLLLVWVLVLFLREKPAIPSAYLWGIRLGLVLLLLASGEGGLMLGHQAHTVGAADGGPGLPIVNWSTQYGDLRVAHFAGMHAFQILPLAGFLLSRFTRHSLACMLAFAAAYFGAAVFLSVMAWQGRPLLAL